MFEIPAQFSNKEDILNFDFNIIKDIIDSDVDNSYIIDNIYTPLMTTSKTEIVIEYYKSILHGFSHIYLDSIINSFQSDCNILLPLLNKWDNIISIDNIIIITNAEDSEKIAKKHIKKAPIFKSILNDSIISTTDNDLWKEQRNEMNPLFLMIC